MRIQVNITEELAEELSGYAKQVGISRSALCAVFIGQGAMSYRKAFELIDKVDFQGALKDALSRQKGGKNA